jgi:ATP-dependent Clp protease ATP-binding subunit ClpA
MNITDRLNRILAYAYENVRDRKHKFITLEHIFYAMLRNSTMQSFIRSLGADVEYMTIMIDRYLNQYIETIDEVKLPIETDAFNRTTNRMFEHLQGVRKEVADEFDFLAAMVYEEDSFFMQLLAKFDITKLDIIEAISNLKRETPKENKNEIDKYTIEMTSEAINYDNVIGRDKEINRVMQILSRRKKKQPYFSR